MSASSIAPTRRVLVIGAGIVGLSAALHLLDQGDSVTILDPRGPGEGASKGNAALIAVDSCLPVAWPGVLAKVPGWLADPLGPLAIRWSYLPTLAPWLARFVLASRRDRVEAIAVALMSLLAHALPTYQSLLEGIDAADMLRRVGWLSVYESLAAFEAARGKLDLQRRRGVILDELDGAEVSQMEPDLAPIFARGVVHPMTAFLTDPFAMVQRLAESFVRRGGTIRREAVRNFVFSPEGPTHALSETGTYPFDAVVVAAGAWSKPLARQLGAPVPLDTERGYHVMLEHPGVHLRRPIYSAEIGFAATPLSGGLRLAGTVELAGLAAAPDYRRADRLLAHGRRMFRDLEVDGATRWMGFRPSMPDSLPVIGRSPRHRNAVLAFGHGHIGLTLGPVTGRLVAELVAGRPTLVDLAPFRPDRFGLFPRNGPTN